MKQRVWALLLTCALSLSLGGAAMAAEKEVLAPSGVLTMADGGLLLTDVYHQAVWRQDADGALTRLAGREGVRGVDGLPIGGYNDGEAADAAFQTPWAAAPYQGGYVISDTDNNVLRYYADGKVSTLAGTGKPGFANGGGTKASFDGPTGLAAGPDGSLYVADTGNHAIRKVDAKGNVTTFAGVGAGKAEGELNQALFLEPTGLYYGGGVLYVADSGNDRICKIEHGAATVVAGGAAADSEGFEDGNAKTALFSHPQGLTVYEGSVYVADTGNGAIRSIQSGMVTTLLRSGEGAGGLAPISPRGLAVWKGKLYVGDVFARTLLTLPLTHGFSDVAAHSWYAPAVAEVSGLGLLRGVTADRFAPAGGLNRGMLALLLSRLDTMVHPGETIGGNAVFTDLTAGAYVNAAAWAVEQGLMTAENGLFLPKQPVSRQEWICGLYALAKHQGMNHAEDVPALAAYTDSAMVPVGAQAAMAWGVSAGVLQGTKDGRLMPAAPITRAQAAVMLQRFLGVSAQ